jgi:Transposase DDE domain
MLKPWMQQGRAVSLDSTALATAGGVWHKKHRELGEIPHSSIDTEAGWSTSGGHGWWYGWKLHLAITVGSVWIPLAAELSVANHADNEVAPRLVEHMPLETRYVLGDTYYNDPELRAQCQRRGADLVATQRGTYPHHDGEAAVRKVLHQLRLKSIELFNGLCKGVFEWRVKMPVKGLERSKLLALGAIVIYQLALLYQHEHNLTLGKELNRY